MKRIKPDLRKHFESRFPIVFLLATRSLEHAGIHATQHRRAEQREGPTARRERDVTKNNLLIDRIIYKTDTTNILAV